MGPPLGGPLRAGRGPGETPGGHGIPEGRVLSFRCSVINGSVRTRTGETDEKVGFQTRRLEGSTSSDAHKVYLVPVSREDLRSGTDPS